MRYPTSLALSTAAAGLALLWLFASALSAQHVQVQHGAPGDAAMLAEVGAMLVPDAAGDAVRVEMVAAPEERPAAYKDVDLQSGDRIIMVARKRVRTPEDLKAAYSAIAVGQPVELGVERGSGAGAAKKIVRFAKADPKTLPQGQRVMVRIEGSPDAEIEVLPALGAVVKQGHAKGSPVEVAAVLPGGVVAFQQGDRLLSLDGKPIGELKAFVAAWDALAVGAPVKLELESGGKRRTESFAKPQPRTAGRRVIQQ